MINLNSTNVIKEKKIRPGRGIGSGKGKTSGRGHKGFLSRSGSGKKPGFEGGQMPLQRRLPKRGFTNIFASDIAIVNVKDLDSFENGTVVDLQFLIDQGLIKKKYTMVKVLGDGDLTKSLTLKVDKVSASARIKVEAAGGKIEEKVS